jgi:hypothetical protein
MLSLRILTTHVFNVTWQDKPNMKGINVIQVNYLERIGLIKHLRGVKIVLSFIVVMHDQGNIAQKTLIDACVSVKVQHFAPSEWATRSHCNIPSYKGKDGVCDYLKLINKDESLCHPTSHLITRANQFGSQILEYTLFQPGLLLSYFSYP